MLPVLEYVLPAMTAAYVRVRSRAAAELSPGCTRPTVGLTASCSKCLRWLPHALAPVAYAEGALYADSKLTSHGRIAVLLWSHAKG